ncbi:MAG TPA: phenylalanine--tRNA ligase subunit beta [Thermoflexia bacterium]|nr:phenylalanine--tRNA ligase subunit beta [Thermoflexia bacterium]
MKVPLSWLKDYVDIPVSIKELAERLTLAGLDVETIEYIGLPGAELDWDPEKIVVGEIRAVYPHPNADRLVLAEVEYGGPEPEVVVSGPPSLLPLRGQSDLHLKVAFAMEGARLWDPYSEEPRIKKLKKARIRGVTSRAMVCSEKELGLSDEHVDIIYLPDDAPVGTPLAEYLGDAVLEFDIKGPFAHLYSVFGIAREAAAFLDVPLRRDVLEVLERHPAELTPTPDFIALEIADPDLCPRYSAAFIRGVEVKPSPFWMQMRLRRAGMRPINNIVDVTNYVMLELGQPLHAFDYHLLRPRPGEDRPVIIVRRAEPGEQMMTLDGISRTFDEEMLLITDGGGPVAVAGVMGGLESEVTEETTDVLLESANFHFLNIRRTSRLLGLTTDASQRFGRRVDPELTVKAAARAAHLMAELAGGTVVPVIGDLYPGRQPQRVVVFDPAYATRVLGVEIPTDEIIRILTSLEFQVSGLQVSSLTDSGEPETMKPETLNVMVPSHRLDVTRPIDLVEEVGRIWGYDRFPTTLMRDELPPQRANPRLEGAERVRDLLTGCGLDEVITYSLVNIEDEGKLRPQGPPPDPADHLRLRNPLSAERAYLRQTLLPSLLHTTRENLRFLDRVAIFEIGAVYLPVEGQTLPDEPRRLGIVMTGPREARSWLEGQDRAPVGFYDLKGVVEALLAGLGLEGTFEPGEHPAFHPGRCAQVSVGDGAVGVMGELHPLVREAFDLPEQPVCALEFDLDGLLAAWGAPRRMVPISVHPPVYEDLALVVDEAVPAIRVRDLIAQTGRPLVRSVVLFDVYRGEQVGAGKKSLAYRLTYQAGDRTLTDREVAKLRAKIVRRLERELGATLRGT